MGLFRYGADNVSLVTVNPFDQGEHLRSIDGSLQVHLDHAAQQISTRLLAGIVQDGCKLWLDLQDPAHLYVLEAIVTASSSDADFIGIRVPRDLVGPVEVNEGGTLSFDNRTTDGGWG